MTEWIVVGIVCFSSLSLLTQYCDGYVVRVLYISLNERLMKTREFAGTPRICLVYCYLINIVGSHLAVMLPLPKRVRVCAVKSSPVRMSLMTLQQFLLDPYNRDSGGALQLY